MTGIGSWRRRIVILALAVGGGGCGGGGGAQSGAIAALEGGRSSVDTLAFSTATTIPSNPPPAVSVTVTDRARVQDLYAATLALPTVAPGTYNCPIDFGVTYEVVFSDGASTVMSVEVPPGGCRFVGATNGTVSAQFVATDAWWMTLALDLGIDEAEIYPYSPPAN